MKNQIYYHVIEEGSYGDIATHGCYLSAWLAQKEAVRLQKFYPNLIFYVFTSFTKDEPVICTI